MKENEKPHVVTRSRIPGPRVLNRIVLHSQEGHSRIVKEKGNSLV